MNSILHDQQHLVMIGSLLLINQLPRTPSTGMNIAAEFEAAILDHQAGRLSDAERVYSNILAIKKIIRGHYYISV